MSQRPIVDYLIARDKLPPPSGLAYDYVLAREGLYLGAENEHLVACIPIASAEVRGLVPIEPYVQLKHGKLPVYLWERFARLARAFAVHHAEVLAVITFTPDLGYELRVPPQRVSASRIVYEPLSDTVLELHSHHVLPAFFSHTDDADEVGLCLYGVVGSLDRQLAELRFRVGAYGYFWPVAFTEVFISEANVPLGFIDLGLANAKGQEEMRPAPDDLLLFPKPLPNKEADDD